MTILPDLKVGTISVAELSKLPSIGPLFRLREFAGLPEART
jgi:hypothetical protein